jgi:hypothetical protein
MRLYGPKTELSLSTTRELCAMPEFDGLVERAYSRDVAQEDQRGFIHLPALGDEQLGILAAVATRCRSPKLAKAAEAIAKYDRMAVPHFEAAQAMITRWLKANAPNGLVYRMEDGAAHPYLVTGVNRYDPELRDRDNKPYVQVELYYVRADSRGRNGKAQPQSRTLYLEPGDVTRKRIWRIFENHGFVPETPELIADHQRQLDHLEEHVIHGFARQYRLDRAEGDPGRRVIMDMRRSEVNDAQDVWLHSPIVWDEEDEEWGKTLRVPMHPYVRVFTLDLQEFYVVNAVRLTPYVYDPELANKLILPEEHMDMLDVLTTNLDAFMSDIIEGKSAGNIILAKGIPGVGKTLTAEVYSELVERPIYAVHSGALGTTPDAVEHSLREIFQRVKRWNCILLLDEADVFVSQRGGNLVKNAIVAVFLRTLEYFGGLMFMTTNRSDDIDDAIISRCAAIIEYGLPKKDDAFAVWSVLASQMGVEISDEVITQALYAFPTATPRDIKQIIRLAARVAQKMDVAMSEDLLRMVAQFRAVEIAPRTADAHRQAPKPRRKRPTRGV